MRCARAGIASPDPAPAPRSLPHLALPRLPSPRHDHVGEQCRAGAEGAPVVAVPDEDRDRRRGELRPYVVHRVVDAVAGQGEHQLLQTWVVPDQQQRLGVCGHFAHRFEQLGNVGPVQPRIVAYGRRRAPLSGRQLPGLPGAYGGGAERQVGQAVDVGQRASGGRGVAAPARGERPLVVGDAVRPGRLGVPQHDQAAQRARSGARDHDGVSRPMSRVSSSPRSRSA